MAGIQNALNARAESGVTCGQKNAIGVLTRITKKTEKNASEWRSNTEGEDAIGLNRSEEPMQEPFAQRRRGGKAVARNGAAEKRG